jgi:predicted DNA binding protein
MGVIATLGVASDDTVLGQLADSTPTSEIEVEPTIPVGDEVASLVWMYAGDQSEVQRSIDAGSIAEVTDIVESHDDHTLYRLNWHERDELVQALRCSDAVLLEASGNADRWRFRIQFADSADLSRFQQECSEKDLDVVPTRIVNGDKSAECADHLSQEQREVIRLGLQDGYFEVPRQCNLQTIADQLDISDQAASARLRRGLNHLLTGQIPTK